MRPIVLLKSLDIFVVVAQGKLFNGLVVGKYAHYVTARLVCFGERFGYLPNKRYFDFFYFVLDGTIRVRHKVFRFAVISDYEQARLVNFNFARGHDLGAIGNKRRAVVLGTEINGYICARVAVRPNHFYDRIRF